MSIIIHHYSNFFLHSLYKFPTSFGTFSYLFRLLYMSIISTIKAI